MLAANTPMFVLVPNDLNKLVLRPGNVVESGPETFVAEFPESLKLEAAMDVIAYGDVRGRFFQQGAVVAEIRQNEPTMIVAFTRSGEPVSAENRQTFRVSVLNCDIKAKINRESGCSVVDMSPDGFAAIAKQDYKIGSLVKIAINYEKYAIDSDARVQTLKILPNGAKRYGFLIPGKGGPARKALEAISSSIQRAQLRRLSGAAA